MSAKLEVQGWRFIPHSYAIVNQQQCLAWAGHPGLTLYHRDAPFFGRTWSREMNRLPDGDEARLSELAPLPNGEAPDAVYRIHVPYDLRGAGVRTAVFMTVEHGVLAPNLIHGGLSIAGALALHPEVVLVTPSRWSKAGLIASGADAERVVVVPHGIDPRVHYPLSPAEREACRKSLGWARFTFLNVGALTGNKGVPLLLEAFGRLLEQGVEATLVLKGLDDLYPSKDLLVEYLKALPSSVSSKIVKNLVYIGQALSASQTAVLYQSADAYVSPYLAEAFNLPVLEAMACGLPVICTRGGPTDDFTDESFCLPIESRITIQELAPDFEGIRLEPSAPHLVAQMRAIVDNDTYRARAGAAGAAHAVRQYSWEAVASEALRFILA